MTRKSAAGVKRCMACSAEQNASHTCVLHFSGPRNGRIRGRVEKPLFFRTKVKVRFLGITAKELHKRQHKHANAFHTHADTHNSEKAEMESLAHISNHGSIVSRLISVQGKHPSIGCFRNAQLDCSSPGWFHSLQCS